MLQLSLTLKSAKLKWWLGLLHLYGWGTYIHKNVLRGQACTWGFHNRKNNKCDLTGHYSDLTTTNLSIINLISPNNKENH
jgi:hypothetical protein